jgi:hypothetical protein
MMKRQRLVVALLVGCGIIAAATITSLAAFVSPAHAAETVTLEEQTDAVAELFRLKQRDDETPKEYRWFMIGQHVSTNGKNAIGYPTYKLFKDQQTCETEMSAIKDDPPPILQGQALSCHPIKQKESTIDVFPMGRPNAILPPQGIPPAAHFVYVKALGAVLPDAMLGAWAIEQDEDGGMTRVQENEGDAVIARNHFSGIDSECEILSVEQTSQTIFVVTARCEISDNQIPPKITIDEFELKHGKLYITPLPQG